ncbi:ImuA family protein [Sphingobium algorifonticola]|uniref:ImuA family protein n=1 Tax=Sphingobium algorifonticola TaxID=2008318 RepID=UPI001F493497|nr:hypothetical protein [Sphingobium algorifonticola]
MHESRRPVSFLKHKIARLERPRPSGICAPASLGHDAIDSALGGGLARGHVHEVFAIESADAGSASGFVAALAGRLKGNIVWLREEAAQRHEGVLHGAGLVEAGLDPARLILGVLSDPLSVLQAAGDVVRCPEIGVAVIELWRQPRLLDLTASRRLALAAETSGVTAILLRIAAQPAPSAAQTRWRVAAAASTPLEANAPGHPAWEVELLRQRGRPAGGIWHVEWDRDRTMFRGDGARPAALPGAVVPFSANGPADAGSVVPLRRTG